MRHLTLAQLAHIRFLATTMVPPSAGSSDALSTNRALPPAGSMAAQIESNWRPYIQSCLLFADANETLENLSVKHKFRWKRRAEQRSRRLRQVLLRGEQVVLVSAGLGPQQQRPQ